MLILLCGNNVRACAFYVECNATRDLTVGFFCCSCSHFSTCIHMLLILLCGNNVQACAFHVECKATRDLTVNFLLSCLNFSTYIHMLFLLCENNVQVCAFHVECNVTWGLIVDFLLYMSKFFHIHPHVILVVWN